MLEQCLIILQTTSYEQFWWLFNEQHTLRRYITSSFWQLALIICLGGNFIKDYEDLLVQMRGLNIQEAGDGMIQPACPRHTFIWGGWQIIFGSYDLAPKFKHILRYGLPCELFARHDKDGRKQINERVLK